MVHVVTICDTPFDDGTTPRERNNKMPHTISIGSKVSYEDCQDGNNITTIGYVLSYLRDCDGTPLYMIGNDTYLAKQYKKCNARFHEIKKMIEQFKPLSKEAQDLRDLCDEQSLLMTQLLTKMNHRLGEYWLTILEEPQEAHIKDCSGLEIIWGPEMYKRFFSKHMYSLSLSLSSQR